LHRVEHVKCDPPIPLRHSRQHVRLPDAGHAVIRLISDSGIRQKCMPGIPSTQPSTTLAELVIGLRRAEPFAAVRTAAKPRASDVSDDEMTHGG
jgi:hypothetical protein